MAKPANLFVPASFTACTNSTAEVVMGSVTIPAYFLRSPYKLGISYAVQTPSTNSTDTFIPRVKINSIVAASLPGGDVISMLIIFAALLGLYEVSVYVALFVEKRKGEELDGPEEATTEIDAAGGDA